MSSDLKMPERMPIDGAVSVDRNHQGEMVLRVMHDGVNQSIVLSEYNAWRIFGLLAVMLEIPLSRAVGKAIKF